MQQYRTLIALGIYVLVVSVIGIKNKNELGIVASFVIYVNMSLFTRDDNDKSGEFIKRAGFFSTGSEEKDLNAVMRT